MDREHRPATDAGFTVLELLVALAVLALILLVVPSTLDLARKAQDASSDLETAAAREEALAFIERTLAAALPLYERDDSGARVLVFEGRTDGLRLAGAVPVVGLARLEIGRRVDGEGRAQLEAVVAPISSAERARRPAGERHVLIERVRQLRFRYFGPPEAGATGPARWHETWVGRPRMPELVEIEIAAGAPGRSLARRIVVELRLRRR